MINKSLTTGVFPDNLKKGRVTPIPKEVINVIIYHDFLPTPRRGSHVKSDKTHTLIKIHPLAHIRDN